MPPDLPPPYCDVSWLLDHATEDPDYRKGEARLKERRHRHYRGYRKILGQVYLELVAM